jgi:hypothetical protein
MSGYKTKQRPIWISRSLACWVDLNLTHVQTLPSREDDKEILACGNAVKTVGVWMLVVHGGGGCKAERVAGRIEGSVIAHPNLKTVDSIHATAVSIPDLSTANIFRGAKVDPPP